MADRWAPHAVDLGMVNGRYFTFAAGMGLDASVVERVDRNPVLKKRFGPFYFAGSAISVFLRKYVVNPPRLEIEVDGAHGRAASACSSRTPRTTRTSTRSPSRSSRARSSTPAAWPASCSTRARPYDVPTVTFRALSGAARIAKHKGIDAFGAFHEAVVRSTDGRTIPIQVDGDHIADETEARFSVAPGALHVVA